MSAAGMTPAAEVLVRRLSAGLAPDAGTLAVLASALGEADPARALALLAAEPDSSEHAPLVELLFSPDAAAMRELEPVLAGLRTAGASGTAELAEEVAARLAGTRLPVHLPGGARGECPAAADSLRGYVRRLRPEATPPAELRGLLARRCDPALAVELTVLLRHSRLTWTPERVFFLATLLDRADSATDDLPGLVAWAAAFLDLSGLPASGLFDPREALVLRRRALEEQLRQAEAAERALEQGSFETRLSQGLRLGHVHGPEVRRELALLDRACRLALGVPGAALETGGRPGVSVRDLGEASDLDELLRLLP